MAAEPIEGVGIFTLDRELVIRSWDSWMERISGISAQQACGKPLANLLPEIARRGLLARFESVIRDGTVEILAPAFHHYLIASPPLQPSAHFARMQQRVTIAPLHQAEERIGAVATIEDVTARLEREQELAAQLTSPDENVRLKAAEALANGEALESIEPLIGALGDSNWRVRGSAVEGLARHGGPDAVAALLKALRREHQELSVLNSALQVLTMIQLDTFSPLVAFLGDPDPELRIFAALALGEMRDPRATPALAAAMEDPDTNVRYHAIEALGKLGAVDAVDALCTIAQSGDFFLAFVALDALTRIGDPRSVSCIIPLLDEELLREPAAESLGRLGDQAVAQPLAALLNEPQSPVSSIAHALAALFDRYEALYGEGTHIADVVRQTAEPAGVRHLIEALGQGEAKDLRDIVLVLGWMQGTLAAQALVPLLSEAAVRKEVVEALVRYGSEVTPLLIEQLEADNPQARLSAVVALGRIGDTRAVPALVQSLQSDDELTVAATSAIARIGDARAFEALIALLGHPEAPIRQAAVAALNSIGHPQTPQRMAELLRHPNPLLRESAVRIAGYFGYPECADLLLELCEDPSEPVRATAVEHIAYLDDPRVFARLCRTLEQDSPRVRTAAVKALATLGEPQAVHCLLRGLRDADPWVRYFSVRALACRGSAHGEPGAIADELMRLARSDPAGQVRIAATAALGEIGGERVLDFLILQAQSPERDIARTALSALGKMKEEGAREPIVGALHSFDASRRMDAVHALGAHAKTESVPSLEWATADSDAQISQAAFDALAHLRSAEAVEALVRLTGDPKRRQQSIEALARLGEEQVPWIGEGLSGPRAAVRMAVVEVLARLKLPRATDRLVEALADPDPSVRLAAIGALRQLGSRKGEKRLRDLAQTDPDLSVRRAARALLRQE